MIFTNFGLFSVVLFFIIIFLWIYFLKFNYKENNNFKRAWKVFLFFTLLLISISLFWPRWWLKDSVLQVKWLNVAFLLDVSKSMYSFDEEEESRLIRAKRLINNFVFSNKENKYSLTIFSWEALKIIPFTFDLNIFNTFLNWVNDKDLSKHGTDLEEAISVWITNFIDTELKWWVLVLITDWWDEQIKDFTLIKRNLDKKKIKLIIIWIWSLKWSYIPTWIDFFWKVNYKSYNGEFVVTKLKESELINISDKLNWEYFRWTDIEVFNKNILWNIEKVKLEKNIKDRVDLTRLFTFIWFMFFILYLCTLFFEKSNRFNKR